ncbi:MAG: hypothetical protein PXZ07_05380 [Candidatus Eremiobacteraeota bacterium]|nr:hypothetical protein [Candidatus Eremiobacteraeota bacterium]
MALYEVPQGSLGDQELLAVTTIANALAVQQIIHCVAAKDAAQVCDNVGGS